MWIQRIPARLPWKSRLARLLLRWRLKDGDADVRTPDGLVFRVPSLREPIAFYLLINGTYEPDVLTAVLENIPRNGTYVDVGANVGALSLMVARRRPDVRVIAIEASPAILPYLHHNVRANALANVRVVECAAASEAGTVDLYVPPVASFGMASTAPQFDVHPTRVRAATLDAILADAEVSHVDVLKLDVEGAEAAVLRGAARLLAGTPPFVVFEFIDWAESRLHAAGEAQRELLKLGYQLEELGGSVLTAPRTTGSATIVARRPSSASGGIRGA